MNLIIDIGNTRAKLAVFDNDTIIDQRLYDDLMICDVEQLLALNTGISRCILSSTALEDESLLIYLGQTIPFFVKLSGNSKLPFTNFYKTPDSLGTDRIALVAGTSALYHGQNILIIDAGSAITYDFLNEKNEYTGGNISPGLEMRFKALHTFTGKLPLFSKDTSITNWGTDTKSAIIAGVQEGIVYEINGYINLYEQRFQNLIVILTGGDAHFFADKLKSTIFVIPNLTLIGLNRILQLHANK
jgi:type III pantothenate kinase